MAHPTYTPPPGLSGPSYFGGNIPSLNRLKTLLILSGHGTISCSGKSFKLSRDYLSIPNQTSGKFRVGSISSKIPGCTHHELKSLLRNAGTKNIRIHENIFLELTHCIWHLEQKSHLASFVHLYRLIEHSALYLPLVSIVSKGINDITFNQYKEVVNNTAKADLSVLKRFSQKILDQNFANSTARYSFSTASHPQSACSVAKELMSLAEISNSGNDFVELKYQHTDRFIINFRNQFFHYLYNEKNISIKDIGSPEEFLEACLPNFLTYFSFLFREFLIAEWEIWAD